MKVYVRFETGKEDKVSEPYGPYPFVQLTYETLRVGPDGDDLAYNTTSGWLAIATGECWTDAVIYAED